MAHAVLIEWWVFALLAAVYLVDTLVDWHIKRDHGRRLQRLEKLRLGGGTKRKGRR